MSFKLLILILQAIFPGFCLLIGLWVVAAKPRDPNAWYVLGILGFIQCFFADPSYWNGPLLPLRVIYKDLAFVAFFLSMLLFGIYFPEPVRLNSRYPWAKWILIAPSLAFAGLDVVIDLGRNVDFRISSWIPSWLRQLDNRTESTIAVICISLFFITLFPKYFTASTRDAKRRLGILVWGAGIGLTPMFIGVVIAAIRNHGALQGAVPAWYFWTCLPCSSSFRFPWPTSSSCNAPWMCASCYARERNTRLLAAPSMPSSVILAHASRGHALPTREPSPAFHTSQTWAFVLALLFLAMQLGGKTATFRLDRPQILPRGLLHRAGPKRAF